VRTPPVVWIVTAVAATSSVPATYAIQRIYQAFAGREPDPALVVWTPHIAMFWRLNVAGYVAGMVAVLTYMAAVRDPARTARVVCAGVLVVGALIGLQGALVP
jgi:hypothetical protein